MFESGMHSHLILFRNTLMDWSDLVALRKQQLKSILIRSMCVWHINIKSPPPAPKYPPCFPQSTCHPNRMLWYPKATHTYYNSGWNIIYIYIYYFCLAWERPFPFLNCTAEPNTWRIYQLRWFCGSILLANQKRHPGYSLAWLWTPLSNPNQTYRTC
jgi:hypothetical protein